MARSRAAVHLLLLFLACGSAEAGYVGLGRVTGLPGERRPHPGVCKKTAPERAPRPAAWMRAAVWANASLLLSLFADLRSWWRPPGTSDPERASPSGWPYCPAAPRRSPCGERCSGTTRRCSAGSWSSREVGALRLPSPTAFCFSDVAIAAEEYWNTNLVLAIGGCYGVVVLCGDSVCRWATRLGNEWFFCFIHCKLGKQADVSEVLYDVAPSRCLEVLRSLSWGHQRRDPCW